MKDIEGFEDYCATEDGHIYSKRLGRNLKEVKGRGGYLNVGLYKNGFRKAFQVHRLIAIAFVPNPNDLPQVNHKDECITNNVPSNLEWCTCQYNLTYGNRIAKAIEARRRNDPEGKSYVQAMETRRKSNPNNECYQQTVKTRTLKGYSNGEKTIAQYDEEMNLIATYISIAEAARKNGFSRGCICQCAKGQKKKYNGYIWRYVK